MTRGTGSGTIGRIGVPQRYAVVVGCAGAGELFLVIEGKAHLGMLCDATPEEVVTVIDRPAGARSVRIGVRADSAVRWAVVATSDPKVPA